MGRCLQELSAQTSPLTTWSPWSVQGQAAAARKHKDGAEVVIPQELRALHPELPATPRAHQARRHTQPVAPWLLGEVKGQPAVPSLGSPPQLSVEEHTQLL